LLTGDALARLAQLPPGSVDAVICDPPYGINFKQHRWDGATISETAAARTGRRLTAGQAFAVWNEAWAAEALRVLKPGGHLAAFGSPRTFHRLAEGLEDAGLQLRDTLAWLTSTGMPKGHRLPGGRNTTLSPAWEPIVLARRPPAGTTTANLDRYGTGALRIGTGAVNGRHPSNLALGHNENCTEAACTTGCAASMLDAAAEATRAASSRPLRASRLFFSTKASRGERDAGCEHLPARVSELFAGRGRRPRPVHNTHPTVKPIGLMRWLVTLLVEPGGLVLDPFAGSGSTGCAAVLEGCQFVGIERDPAYVTIAAARLRHWAAQEAGPGPFDRPRPRQRA
jgi:site-specific DNA-methyltransferase (adenine-specific)